MVEGPSGTKREAIPCRVGRRPATILPVVAAVALAVAVPVSAQSLRRHGVTHVVEWLGTPGALPSDRSGWRRVHAGPDFTVWDVTTAR